MIVTSTPDIEVIWVSGGRESEGEMRRAEHYRKKGRPWKTVASIAISLQSI